MSAQQKVDKNKVVIFDTTMRDGEQSPGATMTTYEKIQVAQQLARLKADVIEAGFPISSPGDFEAVKLIAQQVHGPCVAGLCRTDFRDIDRAWEAVKYAERNRLHTFIATSEIHMKKKLGKTPKEVLKMAVEAVKHCREYTEDIEFSAEDATRSNPDFLCEIVEKTIAAGATTVNIPDTVGYTMPHEFRPMIKNIIKKVPNSGKAIFSVHCHNDLGLATANSAAALLAGARQVECTINGIGERAGNASLEEIVMAIRTRHDLLNLYTDVVTNEIYRTSRLVSRVTGIDVQPNKAIVGKNAFAHEAGIHQDGVLKDKRTYEIMDAESIGLHANSLVLGKHSGRHAFNDKLLDLGYELAHEDLNKAFYRFKELCDKKKEVSDWDIRSIIEDEIIAIPEIFHLESVNVMCGSRSKSTAMIEMVVEGKLVQEAAIGVGPVDAVYQCIRKITGEDVKLIDFSVKSVTGGIDAIGEVTVQIAGPKGHIISGRGASLDIVDSSARAYTTAINKMIYWRNAQNNNGGRASSKNDEAGRGKRK
ncbi:MAG TPA: 2-isopropylmalate synthase [bacterium]|nr:2-isopropylmalate synthase [bacterium]